MGYFYGLPKQKTAQGQNADDIQRQNRALILRLIKQEKTTSRIELAKQSGLKPATISNIIKSFLDENIVCETDLIEGNNGRRVTGIRLNYDRYCTMVVRITRSYYNIGVFQMYDECLYSEKEFINVLDDFDKACAKIKQAIVRCKNNIIGYELLGAGIILEGELIYLTPSQVQSDNSTYKLDDLPWVDEISSELNIPVYVDKSVNMAANWYRNKSRDNEVPDTDDFVYVQVGYSIDCCMVNRYHGITGMSDMSGYLSHHIVDVNGRLCDCGNRGCIGQYVTVEAVKRRVGELVQEHPSSWISVENNIRDIIKAYSIGDPLALAVYGEVAEYLGILAANLAGIFDPARIRFGDELPPDDSFQKAIEASFKKYARGLGGRKTEIQLIKIPRDRKKDTALLGCNQYLFERLLMHMTDNNL
jgi:predicted NBD/HSP70 family sugar kinase